VLPTQTVAWLRRTGGDWSWVAARALKARHGRHEVRLLWALADPFVNRHAGEHGRARAPWPGLRQVCRVERRRTVRRRGQVREQTEVTYAITSLPPERADAAALLASLRGHWSIENRLHHVRDVTFDEDRSQVRCGAAPQTMAACRNLALALLRSAGQSNIAAALRTYAGRPRDAVNLVLTIPR
jgi:predicted transposase YbfD/YdcC